MQLFNLLPAILLAGGAYAGCYSGGEPWPDKQEALNLARSQCNQGLSGDFAGNTHRAACLVAGNGVFITFGVHRLGNTARNLPANECYDGLQKEINGCQYGGDTSYSNWRYVADPNRDSCNPA